MTTLHRLAARPRCWSTALAVALVAAAVLSPGCDEAQLPPTTTDAGQTTADADSAYKAMPALTEPTLANTDLSAARSPAQSQIAQDKIKSGTDFNALTILPGVKAASARVADEVILKANSMVVPLQGNEALLELKKGEVLTGGRANQERRSLTNGNNVFGFMRKVKSVKQIGDSIVLQTEQAQIQDVFAGAVHMSSNLTESEDIDVTGIDLRDFFPGLSPSYQPGSTGGFEQKTGAWGLDGKVPGFQFKVGGERSFPVAMKGTVKGVPVTVDGAFTVKAQMGMEVGIGYGFDIHTPLPDFWNSTLNYMRIYAYGELFAETGFSLDAVAKGKGLTSAVNAALAQAQAANPFKETLPNMETLGTYGPKKGPMLGNVPTTYLIEVNVSCTAHVSSSIKILADAGVKGAVKFGLEYVKKKGFQPINEVTFKKWKKFEITNGKLSGTVECKIGPRIHWMIGGVAGPYIDTLAGARATLTYASTCKVPTELKKSGPPPSTLHAQLEAGLFLDIGGSIELGYKGATLWDYDFGAVPLYSQWWLLWQKTFDLGQGYGFCPSNCENKLKDQGESDVDCGGDVCGICAEGGGCQSHYDCPKGLNCTYGKCSALNSADPCNDGKKSAGEWDVDCGPTCGKCDLGQLCTNHDQCAAGMCSKASGRCESWDCSNGFWDTAGETDTDCGGNCKAKGKLCRAGRRCVWPDDCKKGLTCVTFSGFGGLCVVQACAGIHNFKKDGSETGKDCGGACMKLKAPSSLCIQSQCGYKRFQCPIGQGCKADGDCLDGNCVQGSGLCGPHHCIDKFKNKGESDVDCGGGCTSGPYYHRCAVDKGCNFDADCAKKLSCSNWNGKDFVGQTRCKPFWSNGLWDYKLEPDLDCGGAGSANKCGVNKRCKVQDDCESGLTCADTAFKWVKRCVVKGSCSDGKLSGDEADVDCGLFCGEAGKSGCKAGESCRVDGDCASQKCVDSLVNQYGDGAPGTCATTCENGLLDAAAGEGDVDCGGSVCKTKCGLSERCKSHGQCESGFCSSKTWRCAAATCDDGMVSANESDVDCGGSCKFKCGQGQRCGQGADCYSGLCSATAGQTAPKLGKPGVCLPPLCSNGKRDTAKGAMEADVDCGGVCVAACVDGKTCTTAKDCKSGQCLKSGLCGLDLCQDGKRSGAESDVDCGGGCKLKCGLSGGCATGKDCASGFCDGKVCVKTACADKKWSPAGGGKPAETGVDCGGACAPAQRCAVGVACKNGGDCASGFCDGKVCVKSACEDKKLSVGETDVDCGGSCKAVRGCGFKGGCKVGADCKSNVCDGAVCVTGSCFDKKKTDGETDVDCGGACQTKCSTGADCGVDGDCGSGLCSAVKHVCVTSHCDDGKLSGDETDVDCGGSCKTPCLKDANCKKGSDCVDDVCAVDSAVCVTSTCFDEALTTGVAGKDDELAIDCGGDCEAGCAVAAPCKVTADCVSAACAVTGKCVGSTCEDGRISGDETAKDCGGSCDATCGFALPCQVTADCDTNYCGGITGDKLGKCACVPGLFRSVSAAKCVDCACSSPGSLATSCDAQGRCVCKPGWGGDKCAVKTDVCKADALVCDDDNVCTANTCDAKKGCLDPTAAEDGKTCADGDACTSKTSCKAGKCVAGATVTCQDDGDACTVEKCDAQDGLCKTTALACDDDNPCTKDSCDKVKGCVNAAVKDNTVCAGRGLCLAGKCGCLPMDYMTVVKGASVCVEAGCSLKGTASTLGGKTKATRLHVHDNGGKVPSAGARFGQTVAMAQGRIIVGAPEDSSSYASAKVTGNVFVYERVADGSWTKTKLSAAVASSAWWDAKKFGSEVWPRFGKKVAISGSYAAIGRWENASSGDHTSIWMYRRYGVNNWSYISPKQLRPAKSLFPYEMAKVSSNFGSALAMDGDTIVVGADQAKVTGRLSGALFVYHLSNRSWGFERRLLTSGFVSKNANSNSGFGGVVTVSKGRIAAGLPQEAAASNSIGRGAVRIFVRGGTGWRQEARIYNPNATGQLFGRAVALQGGRLVVSSYPGEIYLYDQPLGQNNGGAWRQTAKIAKPDPKLGTTWVKSLALTNDAVIVNSYAASGLPAAVRIFREVAGTWKVVSTIGNPDKQSTDGFLSALAVDGNLIAVGASRDKPVGQTGAGSVWLFEGAGGHDSQGVCACGAAWSGDKCDVAKDICAALKPNCDDGNACTKDSCDAKKGCVHSADNTAKCDDGDACSSTSVCKAGACVAGGPAKVCAADGDACTVAYCDAVVGACVTRAKTCDDGDPCTVDSCDAKTGCKAVKSGFGAICGGGAGKCQGDACVCAGGTFLSAGLCADCGCDAVGSQTSWSPLTTLTTVAQSPAIQAQRVGSAVALSGDYAAVTDGGLKPYLYSSQPRRVRVLERQASGGWLQKAVLRPAGIKANTFGTHISISATGKSLAASQLSGSGTVHIYERDKAAIWQHRAALNSITQDTNNGFAAALQIDGDQLIVGVPKEKGASYYRPGGVQFFARVAGKWQANGALPCLDSSGYGGNGFQCGKSVALDGSWAAAGAPMTNNGSKYKPNHGAVTMMQRDASGRWTQTERLIPPAAAIYNVRTFGLQVALSGATLLSTQQSTASAGKPTFVVLYRRDGDSWQARAIVQSPASSYTKLALHGGRFLIGGATALSTGAAWLYGIKNGPSPSIVLQSVLTVPGAATGAYVGSAVAMGSGGILLGAPRQPGVDAAGKATTLSGAAYFVTARGSCDGKGKCVCKPGFTGKKCATKVDVCKADKLDCDDGNACTTDSCDAKSGCSHAPNDKASCTDGDLCTSGEQCKAGACVAPKPKTCTNPDKCTAAACVAATGKCATKALSCDDGNPCTADSCVKASGCQHKTLSDGAVCGGGGVCGGGACTCSNGSMLAQGRCEPCSCVQWGAQALPVLYTTTPGVLKASLYFGEKTAMGDGFAVVASGGSQVPTGGKWQILDRAADGRWRHGVTLNGSPVFGIGDAWRSVTAKGNRIAASAYRSGKRMIYVFERSPTGSWKTLPLLQHDSKRLAIAGERIVVADKAKKLEVYGLKAGKWQVESSLHCGVMPISDCIFNVHTSGPWLVVGGSYQSPLNAAPYLPLYLYKRGLTGSYTHHQTVINSRNHAGYRFANDFQIDGDTLVLATTHYDLRSDGSTFWRNGLELYRLNTAGQWTWRSTRPGVFKYYGVGLIELYTSGFSLRGGTGLINTFARMASAPYTTNYKQPAWVFHVRGDFIYMTRPIAAPKGWVTDVLSSARGLALMANPQIDVKVGNVTYQRVGAATLSPAPPRCAAAETGCQWNKACVSDVKGGVTCK